MKMKRVVSLLLCCVLLCALIPLASAEDTISNIVCFDLTSNSVTISWSKPDVDYSTFLIILKEGSSPASDPGDSGINNPQTQENSYSFTGLNEGTTYTATIFAVDGSYASLARGNVTFTTLSEMTVSAVRPTWNAIQVKWNAIDNAAFYSLVLYDSENRTVASRSPNGNVQSYTFLGLDEGEYRVKVYAIDSDYNYCAYGECTIGSIQLESVRMASSGKNRTYTFPNYLRTLSTNITGINAEDETIVPYFNKAGRLVIPGDFIGEFMVEFLSDSAVQNVYRFSVYSGKLNLNVKIKDAGTLLYQYNWIEGAPEYLLYIGGKIVKDVDRTQQTKASGSNTVEFAMEPGKKYTCKVVALSASGVELCSDTFTVVGPETPAPAPNPVVSFKVSKKASSLDYSGRTMKLYPNQVEKLRIFGVKPADADTATYTWKSSNTNVVTVKNGTLTAKKTGTAMITVRAVDSAGKVTAKVSFKVKVVRPGQ